MEDASNPVEIDVDNPPPIKDYSASCDFMVCPNGGVVLDLKIPGDFPNILCGVCDNPITEVTIPV